MIGDCFAVSSDKNLSCVIRVFTVKSEIVTKNTGEKVNRLGEIRVNIILLSYNKYDKRINILEHQCPSWRCLVE